MRHRKGFVSSILKMRSIEELERAFCAPRHSLARRFNTKFHHPWCNLSRQQKTYVKEGLQRPRDVLLSGPFKKFQNEISSTLRYGFFAQTPRSRILKGQTSGIQVFGSQ
jgi:hypothetical protein